MDSSGLDEDQTYGGDQLGQEATSVTGSPMQQSPDQSNCNENYRSPEAVDELPCSGLEMETGDVKAESSKSKMDEDASEPDALEEESFHGVIEGTKENNFNDDALVSGSTDINDCQDPSESDMQGSPVACETNTHNDGKPSIEDACENKDDDINKWKKDYIGSSEDFSKMEDEEENTNLENEKEGFGANVPFSNDEDTSDHADHSRHADLPELNDDKSNLIGEEDKDVIQGGETFETRTDANQADTSADMKRISSFVDVVSDNDKIEGSVPNKQDLCRSSEVSSTSCEDNVPLSGNTVIMQELDSKTSGEIQEIEHEIDEIESSDSIKAASKVKGIDRERVLKDVKSHLNASASDLDNYSTVSIKGSSSSSSDGSDNENDNLDLTEPLDREIIDKNSETTSNTGNAGESEGDEASVNVSSSTKDDVKSDSEADTTKTEHDTELSNSIETELDTSKQVSQDDDKNSEASLEEISDDDMEDDNSQDVSKEKEEESNQLSGMEEVSSEEEDEDDDGKEQKNEKSPQNEKSDPKTESGMEEVSDEEDISGDGKISEDGMENVSSEEEEDKEEVKIEKQPEPMEQKVDNYLNSKMKVDPAKQKAESIKIDDSGKDDSTIVEEIVDNLLREIGKEDADEKKESKRKKLREKKDRHEKEKRDKDRKEGMKDRRESVKARSRDTQDINERLKAQASYGEDVELDYDDTVHDEAKEKQGSESEGELSNTSSSDGELEEEEECEEGEIMEPGQKPYVKPTCRFFMRGHCTWGINCRFLHPGVNDKGNYQLIERPGFNNKPPPPPFEEKWEEEEVERTPSPEPPPPPAEPKEETAWERGLRQAKELRKKAMERRKMETNFEHKKMNLSIEDNPEFDKENNVEKSPVKSPVKKTPYYDKYEPLSDDEYYDQTPMRLQQKQMEQSWMMGGYENFQVHWTQDQYPQSQGPYPPHMGRFPYPQDSRHIRGQERYPLRPSPRRLSPSPPDQQQRYMRAPQRDPREMIPREKMRDPRGSPPPPTKHTPSANKPKADEYIDPWTRANANKGKSPKKRSRSRGRRRSRRSYSYSSSYSSSSYTGSSRSRSRSSSFSSVSSHSSRSSSLSRSRSPPPRSGPRMRGMRRPIPAGNQPMRRPTAQARLNEPPARSANSMQGRADRGMEKRQGLPSGSPTKGMKGPVPPSRQLSNKGSQQIADVGHARKPQQRVAGAPVQPQKPLPQSALTKDRVKAKPGVQRGRASSSSSRSRSRSRSSSSSSRSSFSSRSSRSYSRSRSRSSSSSSTGSADSDHLYRNIGTRENQKVPQGVGRGRQDMARHGRPPAAGHVPQGRPSMKPTIGETSRPSSVAQAKMVKDPLKMTGQKSNIKLTLIKQSEKPPPGAGPEPVSRKRPAEPVAEAPPTKRPSVPNPKADKPVRKAEKTLPVSPAKAVPRPAGPVIKPAAGAPAAAAIATVKKKSTVSRREELLKQLKAVEDAIAKKKKKMG